MKKRLTSDQEFQILKLVLDKFLWLGFGILVVGFFQLAIKQNIESGVSWIVSGAVVLLLFIYLIVKHYEILWIKKVLKFQSIS